MAEKFNCDPQDVPAEAVWFLDFRPMTQADIEAGQRIWREIQDSKPR